jgi:hypothetical protein
MDIQPLKKYSDEEMVIDDNGTGVELEDTSVDEQIIEPFDPSLIRVDTKPMTIDLLRLRIEYNELDLAPDFQRKADIWKDEAQSRLIESMLIRIPLPAFYMDATNEEKWLVVDGLQRLTTLKKFMVDKTLKLHGLEFLKQFDGKGFDELPRNYQRRIAETQVTVYLIEKGTPDEVKFNIFKRINTGGLPLSSQEIRHALNQGEATRMLIRLADSEEFKQAVDNGIKDERMADRECVLRYMAFTLTPYTKYDKDSDGFLNRAMKTINKISNHEREELEQRFIRAMKIAKILFGNDAFRKRYREGAPRLPINKPLFECWSVNFNQLSDEQVGRLTLTREILRQRFIDLMNSPDGKFKDAISLSTGDPKKVRLRFEVIEQLIKDVLS